MSTTCVQIAVNKPLARLFDYLPGEHMLQPGMRVMIPFNHKAIVGMVVKCNHVSDLSTARLKPILDIIDPSPILSPDHLSLCHWLADYYHHPLGEIIFHTLPRALRQATTAVLQLPKLYQLSELGKTIEVETLKQAPKLTALIQILQQHPCDQQQLKQAGIPRASLVRAIDKGWLQTTTTSSTEPNSEKPLPLNEEQTQALKQIELDRYSCSLLHGVTGSGKTEVYLQLMEQVLQADQQVMILVPEISLTPQTIQRFRARLPYPTAVLHSKLSDKERMHAWLASQQNHAKIMIGTRSAVFTPAPDLGLIIIDEEHDSSFKQQHGFRYHARNVALVRAKRQNIPVVLGSATPSLESYANTQQKGFAHIKLNKRAAGSIPRFQVIDMTHQPAGISTTLLEAMQQHLARDEQVLLFINRRGFSPVLLCHDCCWIANCDHCDARLVYHQSPKRLHCHHCGTKQRIPAACPSCDSQQLRTLGQGTQRIEATIAQHFPNHKLLRVDRDTSHGKHLITALQQAQHADILIGTQMLAKGHHFPNVTLVGIIDCDHGFFSSELRASEQLAQLIIQVAGRAGRADKPGTVLLQTHFPKHPLLNQLLQHDYQTFLDELIKERQAAHFPPFSHQALLRVEAKELSTAMQWLRPVKSLLNRYSPKLSVLGPVAAMMQRKAGVHRAQLLLQADKRGELHTALTELTVCLQQDKAPLRWSIDVDPISFD